MAAHLIFSGHLCTLSAEGLGIHGCPKFHCRIAGGGQAKSEQSRLWHELHAVSEFVVEISNADTGASIPKLLIYTPPSNVREVSGPIGET